MEQNTSQESRPQIAVKASDLHKHLSNNELVSTDEITTQYKRKKKTIMDEPLHTIIDKTLNFMVYSVDDYSQALDEVSLQLPKDSLKGMSGSVKLHLYSFMRFCQISDNLIYIGILCVILSIIIYFLNITVLG
jgi:hypothetical protein